jgi:hypothetical protein
MTGNQPFSDEQIALAASNYEAQVWLVGALKRAFKMSGLSIEDLALELDLDLETATGWIHGDVDLTLSELRHLANAVDAKVAYRVEPIRNRYVGRFKDISERTEWAPVEVGSNWVAIN